VSDPFVEVPPERLDPETLRALVESFVNREGTDYGTLERTLSSKVDDVFAQLRRGAVVICFDLRSESCTLLLREDLHRLRREAAVVDQG